MSWPELVIPAPPFALPDPVTIAVPAFVGLIVVELILIRMGWAKGRYETRDMAASLWMGFGNLIAKILLGGVGVYCISLAYHYRLFTLGWSWPIWVACFFAEDHSYYWFHRIAHERRFFWSAHVIHHSSQHYNLSTALRQSWTGVLALSFIFWMPLAWLGFHPAMIFLFSGISLVYQFWIHTESIGRMGPLESILNTPSHHRVHHATNPIYLDANYAGVLIIWDRLYGTFTPERDDIPPHYGIISALGTFNPLRIAFHEWVSMIRDVVRAPNWRAAWYYAFGAPGWSHDGSRKTSKALKAAWLRHQKSD